MVELKEIKNDLPIVASRRPSIARILLAQSLIWTQYSLSRLPIRMTLSNLGILAVVLTVVLPRPITYMLLYPIFRLVFGNLYPAYASYKAVRTKNVKEYVKWMMYWIVFALFTCAETFTDVFFSFWFPFYYEIKTILVVWLLSPATKGSSILYRRFVHPLLIRHEAEIDEALARATEQGYTAVLHLGTKGVNYATTVLMQTAIKGGGGLVQHLRKSYSLSDLTGEKEDENRNTPDAHDETDMEVEPRRREHVGRRGYSPRRTQSSSNRVEMYFSEVDVDVRQPRPREPIASLTNIRSSDDISSGYSSGEALQSHRTTSQGDSLVRTSSVGARTRAKPRSTTKKTPEGAGEDIDYDDLPSSKSISFPPPLNLMTPEQALELLLLLSQNSNVNEYIKFAPGSSLVGNDDLSHSKQLSPVNKKPVTEVGETSTDSVNVNTDTDMHEIQTVEIKKTSEPVKIQNETEETIILSVDTRVEETKLEKKNSHGSNASATNILQAQQEVSPGNPQKSDDHQTIITDEICQNKFDELKQLLSDAHKAINSIAHSQEELKQTDLSASEILPEKDIQNTILNNKVLPKTATDNIETNSNKAMEDINSTKIEKDDKKSCTDNDDDVASLDLWSTPNVSRSNSDSIGRAGKYNKMPAPKAPSTKSDENLDDTESQNALKATLVIKTGTLKTFSNTDTTKDVFFAHSPDGAKSKAKKSKKQRTKEGFSKLLTIPKNIFQTAFHKEHKDSGKSEDASSTTSEISGSESRSNSIASQEAFVELTPKSVDAQEEVQLLQTTNENGFPHTESDSKNGLKMSNRQTLTQENNDAKCINDDLNIQAKELNENTLTESQTTSESQAAQISPSSKVTKEIISDIF